MSRDTIRFKIDMNVVQEIQLNTTGVVFNIHDTREKDHVVKLGTMTVSAGGVRFIPAGHRRPFRVDWADFSEIMRVFGRLQ